MPVHDRTVASFGKRMHRGSAGLLFVMAAACQPATVKDTKAAQVASSPAPTRRPKMKTAKLSDLVELAKADLLKRLKQQNDAGITVVSAEYVSWPSPALGCPQPDRAYPMVITPGALIQLSFDGKTYDYHSSRRGPPFICEAPGRPQRPAPKGSGHDPNDPT